MNAKEDATIVLVRTRETGIHVGELDALAPGWVALKNARRLVSWPGAGTLNEVAVLGVDRDNSLISAAVPVIYLAEAVEIIPVSPGIDLSPTENKPGDTDFSDDYTDGFGY